MSLRDDSPNNFCRHCYDEFMRQAAKKSAGNKNVFVDVKKMSFRCKIPTYTHDRYGEPIVVFTNCETRKSYSMPLKEFQKKRIAGEL